ncbi:MAG: MBOAT family O-acyltransferase [Steroidobacteraceae bacterium]
MSFVEIEMFFFLPAVLLLYWLVPRRAWIQNLVLLAASWVFYSAWNWRWLPLLIGGALIDYSVARTIERRRGEEGKSVRRFALATSLCWNLGALAYFKYANFFLDSAADLLRLLGAELAVPTLSIILPLGISFYTLQRISYVLDVYYERAPACRSFLQFLLYSGYFPQLTAGPIARASELLNQFATARTLTADNVARGSGEFLLGFALKAWVADFVGGNVVTPVFASPASFTVASHWLALVAYGIQVFGDFAGYSLMAIGCSRLFGIELPVNFNHPFLSKSLPEFWRRWHITLNRWLFDYIYTPMTTSRGWFRGRLDLALFVTFIASGLWHGAAITFVLWGLWHAVGMVVQRHWDELYKSWCRKDRRYVQLRKGVPYAAAAWFLTQFYFVLSLVPFRARDGQTLGAFARGLLASDGNQSVELGKVASVNLILSISLVVAYHLTGTPRVAALWNRFLAMPAPVRGFAYGCVVAYLILFVPVGASTFIYRQF